MQRLVHIPPDSKEQCGESRGIVVAFLNDYKAAADVSSLTGGGEAPVGTLLLLLAM